MTTTIGDNSLLVVSAPWSDAIYDQAQIHQALKAYAAALRRQTLYERCLQAAANVTITTDLGAAVSFIEQSDDSAFGVGFDDEETFDAVDREFEDDVIHTDIDMDGAPLSSDDENEDDGILDFMDGKAVDYNAELEQDVSGASILISGN
jgi:hypothetical protein